MNCPHCETEIDEHEASRCLDAWVWAIFHPEIELWYGDPTGFEYEGNMDWWRSDQKDADDEYFLICPRYSTDIAAAWEVQGRFADYLQLSGADGF